MSGMSRHFAASHAGTLRRENEDAVLCRPEIGLYLVADGAGGHRNGAIAAARVVASAATLTRGADAGERLALVRRHLSDLHDRLLADMEREADGRSQAATVVALLLDRRYFVCLWAGDSRLYLLRDGILRRLTQDHSVGQEMIDAGLLDPPDAERHRSMQMVTRAIGAGTLQLRLDKRIGQLLPYDRFLLCSDGLTRALDDALIRRCLEQGGNAAQRLIDEALRHRARDNVTAIVVLTE